MSLPPPPTVRDICGALDAIAPLHLAEEWDQVGLQVGDYDAKATRGLVCIDYTPAVFAEAKDKGCDFVVAYHPPMFKPLKRLVGGDRSRSHVRYSRDWKQELLLHTVREGLAVYSPHTALDAVRGGVNDWLCDGLGAASVRFAIAEGKQKFALRPESKVVVYVPRGEAAERVRRAMGEAGAGGIGRYSECSFNLDGTGTFRPGEGANPAIGEVGELERVEETRVEMLCGVDALGDVLRAVRAVHPYEEPAIDVLPLRYEAEPEDAEQGAGRVHHLKTPVTPAVLARRVKKRLGLKQVRLAGADATGEMGEAGKVSAIAACVGSGGSLFETYPNADVYVTGEMQHHQLLDLVERGKAVILAGHTNTERPFLPRYVEMIEKSDAGGMAWSISEADMTPWEMR